MKKKENQLLILFVLVFLVFWTGCKTSNSVITNNSINTIKANIDITNVVDDKVKVILNVSGFVNDTAHYFIPKIVPGTYQNNDYGKFIENFEAFDANNLPLTVIQSGTNGWKISNGQQLKKISYWVNDTFDSEESHDIFSPTGTNILKDTNFVLNLYAFIGYFKNLTETPYKLSILYPKNLSATTSKDQINSAPFQETGLSKIDQFEFKRYADLVDTPIMYSNPDVVSFEVNGIEVFLSMYSPSGRHKASRVLEQLERTVRAQTNFLGSINTTKKYSILLYLSSSSKEDAKGYGALEHNTSTVVVLPESIPTKKLNETLRDVVSHEFFHIITPLTIHSEEIHYFDYNQPKMSQHLWLYEGTIEYFSLLFQIREALMTNEEFLERILEKIEASKQYDNQLSFTEMSQNILQEPYISNYRNVYEKGALISMCLDIIIRERSDGLKGILDLVKILSTHYGSDIPFEDTKLIPELEKFTYPEVIDFLNKYVTGNEPIPYKQFLNKVGVIFDTTEIPSQFFMNNQTPYIEGDEVSQTVMFSTNTVFNNFLNNLGIKGGDTLLRIDNKRYSLKNIYSLFSDSQKWKIGEPITFHIQRDGKPMQLTTKVVEPTIQKAILAQDPDSSMRQRTIFKRWTNGL